MLAVQSAYATVLAVVLLGGMRVLRISAPAAHEAAWWLVLARLVVPPGMAAPWSLRSLGEWIAGLVAAGGPPAASGDVALAGAVRVTVASPPTGLGAWWPALVSAAWLLGVVVLGSMLAIRIGRYRRVVRHRQLPGDGRLERLVEGWRHTLGVRRRVAVVVSDRSLMSFTVGVRRPVVHLPAVAATWSDELIAPILAHEMAHVARWDALRIGLANVVRVGFFFHPLAWLACSRLARAREIACDDLVLASGGVSARDYGRSLLGVLRLNLFGTVHADAVLGLVDHKEGVEMRLEAIRQLCFRSRPKRLIVVATFGLMALLLLPMASAGVGDRSGPSSPEAATFAATDPVGGPVYDFMVDGPITEPVRLDGPNPEYPEEARAARIQGVVVLRTTILADGTVGDVEVERGLPLGLTEAALAAIRQWRFTPATLDGQPVAVHYVLTVRFQLDDSESIELPTGLNGAAAMLHVGNNGQSSAATVERLSQVLQVLERELPAGLRISDLAVRDSVAVVNGAAELEGGETAVAELLARLTASPELAGVNLKHLQRTDDSYRFVLECSLAE